MAITLTHTHFTSLALLGPSRLDLSVSHCTQFVLETTDMGFSKADADTDI